MLTSDLPLQPDPNSQDIVTTVTHTTGRSNSTWDELYTPILRKKSLPHQIWQLKAFGCRQKCATITDHMQSIITRDGQMLFFTQVLHMYINILAKQKAFTQV